MVLQLVDRQFPDLAILQRHAVAVVARRVQRIQAQHVAAHAESGDLLVAALAEDAGAEAAAADEVQRMPWLAGMEQVLPGTDLVFLHRQPGQRGLDRLHGRGFGRGGNEAVHRRNKRGRARGLYGKHEKLLANKVASRAQSGPGA